MLSKSANGDYYILLMVICRNAQRTKESGRKYKYMLFNLSVQLSYEITSGCDTIRG